MHHLINHNGKIVPAAAKGVSPVNAGLLHGHGVFTTLRIYNTRPFMFDEHWQRLEHHARAAGLSEIWEREAMRAALNDLINANKVSEGKARITLLESESRFWRLDATPDKKTDLLIFTAPLHSRNEAALTISPYRINSGAPLAGIKITNILQQIITLKEAEARGFDEAVVLNERGEICEAAAANIFWVRGGVLYTPTVNTGCLAGIARHLVLELAHKLRIELSEGAFQSEHILTAEEAFLTSSTRELTRVTAINLHQFPGKVHSVFERLLRAYHDRVFEATKH